jgi:hypothetical protein
MPRSRIRPHAAWAVSFSIALSPACWGASGYIDCLVDATKSVLATHLPPTYGGEPFSEIFPDINRFTRRSRSYLGASIKFIGRRSTFENALLELQKGFGLPSESIVRTELDPDLGANALRHLLSSDGLKQAVSNAPTETVILVPEGFVPLAGRLEASQVGSQPNGHLILQQAIENSTAPGHSRWKEYGEHFSSGRKRLVIFMPVVEAARDLSPYPVAQLRNAVADALNGSGTFWNFHLKEDIPPASHAGGR